LSHWLYRLSEAQPIIGFVDAGLPLIGFAKAQLILV